MSPEFIIFFSILSFLTSLLTSIFSVGGGLIMLVALAQYFSPGTLIPLHGAIQLSNNLSRTFVYREFYKWKLIKNILAASIFGAFSGILLFGSVPEQFLIWLIAGTILFFTWAPLDNFILSIMRNEIVPAISQIKNCSGTEPNNKIPLSPPNIEAIKIFLISFH